MGGGVSLPNITKYREEYLVDTETNEIIYPKVLPSSITIPPAGDNDDSSSNPVIPDILRGGIDPNSYTTFKIDLTNKAFINQGTPPKILKIFDIDPPGIYSIAADINFGPLANALGSTVPNFEVSITSQRTGARIAGHKGFMDRYGYFRITVSNIIKITETDKSLRLWYWTGVNFTLSSGNIIISYIKLCDLPETTA